MVCEKCESGYALNQNEDQCVTSPFDGCQKVKADDSTQCDKCLWDYYQLKDDQCSIESSDFCEEYDDNGDCEKCEKYFYLDDEKKCQYIRIPYCKKVEKEDKEQCHDYDGFINDKAENINIENDKINYIKNIGCEEENDNGCYKCNAGYTLDEENHVCVSNCQEYINPSPLCKYCEHGYVLSHEDTACIPVLSQAGEGEGNDEGNDD